MLFWGPPGKPWLGSQSPGVGLKALCKALQVVHSFIHLKASETKPTSFALKTNNFTLGNNLILEHNIWKTSNNLFDVYQNVLIEPE